MSDQAFPVGVPDTQITDDSGQFSLDDLRATPEEAARFEALVAVANWLPDDMVERAARTQSTRWDSLTEETQDDIRSSVREILCAALAGRTVVDLPEPDGSDDTGTWWRHDHGSVIADDLDTIQTAQFMRRRAAAILAAAVHIEKRLGAAGGSQVGDQR